MEKKYKPKTREELVELCDDHSIHLGDIDTSLITDMSFLFQFSKRKDFSGIESWDTSKVADMSYMFANAIYFNQPLNSWDMSNVIRIDGMFFGAESFNQDLSNWNVSSVTSMLGTFQDARSFNKPLEKWNVSSVTIMSTMFGGATSFNQPLGKWNVKSVINMNFMFSGAASFNQDLSSWNVKNNDLSHMFSRSNFHNDSIAKWDFSSCSLSTHRFFGKKPISYYTNVLQEALEQTEIRGYSLGFDDTEGEYTLTHDESGEVYHLSCELILLKYFDRAIRYGIESLETRLESLRKQALLAQFAKEMADQVVVTAEDSYKAGNCVSGTALFCRRHKISLKKGIRGDLLLKKLEKEKSHDKDLALNALLSSLRRNGIELPA